MSLAAERARPWPIRDPQARIQPLARLHVRRPRLTEERGVVLLALLAGVLATLWSLREGAILAYGDAQAHLEIARRVVDSRTPSIAELGSVWLPVPHLLLLPFALVNTLWQSGLAGACVGVPCLAIVALAVFRSVRLLTEHRAPAWLAVGVLLTNPNLLYISTTALTEPVLLASMAGSLFFLLRWTRYQAGWRDLFWAGGLAALAVGSRYEGWAFAAASALVVVAVTTFVHKDPQRAEGYALAYTVLPVYAMGLWVFYNWLIFGDPLAFAHGQYSAQGFAEAGHSLSKGNLRISLSTFSYAVLDDLGAGIAALGLSGLLLYAIRTRLRPSDWGIYAILSLFPFQVLLLWLGQTIITTPQSLPAGIYNVRYGLVMLPAAALLIGYLSDSARARVGVPLVLLCLVGQLAMHVPNWSGDIILLAEGRLDQSMTVDADGVASYLDQHYAGGGILADEVTANFVTRAGIPLREYIGSFNGDLWYRALRDPSDSAAWVIMSSDASADRVTAALDAHPAFRQAYRLEFQQGQVRVFRRTT